MNAQLNGTLDSTTVRTIALGDNVPVCRGDTVWAQLPDRLVLAVVTGKNGSKFCLRLEEDHSGKAGSIFELSAKNVTNLRRANKLPIEFGCRVEILQHKHLRCAEYGHVSYINGGYISVESDFGATAGRSGSVGAKDEGENVQSRMLELYPNEIKVVQVFRHSMFSPGTAVKIKGINWGRKKVRPIGTVLGVAATTLIVHPTGAMRGATVSIAIDTAELA